MHCFRAALPVYLVLMLGVAAAGRLHANAGGPADGHPIDWNAAEVHDLGRSVDGQTVSLTTTGVDPFLVCELPSVNVLASTGSDGASLDGASLDGASLNSANVDGNRRDFFLSLEYLCPQGVRGVELFVGLPAHPANRVSLPPIAPSEGWTTYKVNLSDVAPAALDAIKSKTIRIDLGRIVGVRIEVRNVRLRPASDLEIESKANAAAIIARKQDLAAKIDDYYAMTWPATITDVTSFAESTRVQGVIDASLIGQPLGVVTRGLHETAALPVAADRSVYPIDSSRREFQIDIPYDVDSDLELPGARFQIVRANDGDRDAVSAARYLDGLSSSRRRDLDPPVPLKSAKGMTCLNELRSDEIKDLGLRHGSVNILLNGLIRLAPHPGYQSMHLSGREVFFQVTAIADLDRRVRLGTDAGLQMAAILLVANRDAADDPLVHPQADRAGTYAMPNLTTRASAELYAWTLMFLADRYATSDDRHGRIDQWIVHNEVDAGWHWTNMGEQPMSVFLDHYFRSMRMVDAAMRQVNPHARAYLSLTHHWNPESVPKWRWYGAKPIVESLVESGRVEGDFPWAMAYHPYPQSLWESDTWNDDPDQVTDDFDTPKITMKNLEVLDRYLHTDGLRTRNGAVRPMICSEQGFHADEDNPDQLRDQVTALLYTFDVLGRCPSVIAFDYHRPIDNRREGGLRLGLRGLVSPMNRRGVAKPAWEVYKAIGTDAEADLRDQHRSIWSAQ